jgi:ligand-binding sensor domain-containing protein/DNA-binding response OmpR family regulator
MKSIFTKVLIQFFVLLIFGFPVFGQDELSFRQLSVNDGLSQNSVVSITQDNNGFLWIATQEGLNRYDGREFVVYNRKFLDVTESARLLLGKVFADSKNRIWIIPESSVPELLDRSINDFVPVEGVHAANCVFEDKRGDLWFGTLSGQLYRWNESIEKAEMIWADPKMKIASISGYDDQHFLITFNHGLGLWNTESQKLAQIWNTGENIKLSSAKTDKEGKIWIGTLNSGLWVIKNQGKKAIPLSEYFSSLTPQNEMILDIHIDSKNRVWLATYGKGAALVDEQEKVLKYFKYSKINPRSIYYDDILCIFEDYTGTLWFGSDGAGLSFYDAYLEKFNFYHNQQVPENINIDVVRAIFVEENDQVWLGTSGKGLTKFNPDSKTWKTLLHQPNNPQSISSDRVMSLLGDENGKLWIGYQDEGLSILNLKTNTFQHFNERTDIKFPETSVWKIHKDQENRFWLCTRNEGLIWFDPQKGIIKKFTHDPADPNSIPDNNIRTVVDGNAGELWIGTENQGIARFDLKSQKFFPIRKQADKAHSISSNSIKSLYLAPGNILWIGTNGAGLNLLDLNSMEVKVFNTETGLPNDVIYGILPDQAGNLWMSSNKGITKVTKKNTENPEFEITNYSNYDGLATEFNTGAYFRQKDGTLYFGSLEGFYWFNAEDIFLNEIEPKTIVTDVFVFDKKVQLSDGHKLRHDQNTLTINMASLVFSSPRKNEFQYMLQNHDENWVKSGNNHQARYTDLSPGNYTFLVKSSNYDGIWSEEPASLSFTILPPWYLTSWAKLLYFLSFVLGVTWIYQYLKWRWKMQYSLKVKDDEAKRLMEIDEFKTNLFTNISHEFRTPLTLIAGPVERLMVLSENPVLKSQLNLIKQNSRRLLHLVDQLLEVSKIKSGKQQLKVQKGNLGLLLQSIVSNFFYLAAEKDLRLSADIPLMTELWFDADKVEKIVSNLIQNAIKYSKPGTDINLTAKVSENQFYLQVSNVSVKKYSKEEEEQLFDQFFKPDLNSEGFGIGLPLIKDLVKINHGKINLKLENKNIFQVDILLPVDKFSFRPAEVMEEDDEDFVMAASNLKSELAGNDAPLVLVVEDNDKVRSFLVHELQAHYQVLEANNGKSGLFLALKKIPDLVISDVMMPEMDGIELCEKLKNDEKTSHIPIILLTAKSEEQDKLKGLEVGADDYILKPFAVRQLLVRIEKLIELRRNLRIRYSGKTVIAPNEISITSTDEKFLEKIKKIINEDLSDASFSVDEFCRILGMSRMQLHRKLTALTGLSTSAFYPGSEAKTCHPTSREIRRKHFRNSLCRRIHFPLLLYQVLQRNLSNYPKRIHGKKENW